jgi:hypothetical protein
MPARSLITSPHRPQTNSRSRGSTYASSSNRPGQPRRSQVARPSSSMLPSTIAETLSAASDAPRRRSFSQTGFTGAGASGGVLRGGTGVPFGVVPAEVRAAAVAAAGRDQVGDFGKAARQRVRRGTPEGPGPGGRGNRPAPGLHWQDFHRNAGNHRVVYR